MTDSSHPFAQGEPHHHAPSGDHGLVSVCAIQQDSLTFHAPDAESLETVLEALTKRLQENLGQENLEIFNSQIGGADFGHFDCLVLSPEPVTKDQLTAAVEAEGIRIESHHGHEHG